MPHRTEQEWRDMHREYRNARRTNYQYYHSLGKSEYRMYAWEFRSSRHQNKNRRIDMRHHNKVLRRDLRLSVTETHWKHFALIVK